MTTRLNITRMGIRNCPNFSNENQN
jgi:hypothetical protein